MKIKRGCSAFTLIELLTVIAITAVLVSLLLTGLASAKKKSRTVVCTFNLHQISLALNMYLDDSGGKRPAVENLIEAKYLASPQSLLCPEDKTGNWGRLAQTTGPLAFVASAALNVTNFVQPINYSYLMHPLGWDDAAWNALMRAGGNAGVTACQLHGLGTQDAPNIHNYSGLLLRAQRDGAVVRRQLFWSSTTPSGDYSGGVMPSGSGTPISLSEYLYPIQIYLDNPATWSPTGQ